MNKFNSQYTSITGGNFLFNEFKAILPLLQDKDNREQLLKDEVLNNRLLQINSQTSRSRFVTEMKRRYLATKPEFWNDFNALSQEGQKAKILFSIIKAYKLVYDFHFNVTIKHWNSTNPTVTKTDLLMEFNEIASNDEFVDTWSDATRGKCSSCYLTFLRHSGLMNENNELKALRLSDEEFEPYLRNGDEWFLQACLLQQYEINDLKSRVL